MTLTTSVAVDMPSEDSEVAAWRLYAFVRELVDTPSDVKPDPEPKKFGHRSIWNPPGIGLNAWVWVNYDQDIHEHGEDCEDPDEAKYLHSDPTLTGLATHEVNFDTVYGYCGDNGETCSDLHARYITAVGRWCDQQGLKWWWQNEFTGEWHQGAEGLAEFGDAFRDTGAEAWFQTKVIPAIAASIGR